MADPKPPLRGDAPGRLRRDARRLERRKEAGAAFWRSLPVLGTIGWSVALPTAGGAWLGHRIDRSLGTGVRFTLMLLFAGLLVGSVVAWRAVREHGS